MQIIIDQQLKTLNSQFESYTKDYDKVMSSDKLKVIKKIHKLENIVKQIKECYRPIRSVTMTTKVEAAAKFPIVKQMSDFQTKIEKDITKLQKQVA